MPDNLDFFRSSRPFGCTNRINKNWKQPDDTILVSNGRDQSVCSIFQDINDSNSEPVDNFELRNSNLLHFQIS